jgi:hypothetical protein
VPVFLEENDVHVVEVEVVGYDGTDIVVANAPGEPTMVALKSCAHHSQFLCAKDDRTVGLQPHCLSWEVFRLEDGPEGTKFLRSAHGKYLSASNPGVTLTQQRCRRSHEQFVFSGDSSSMAIKTHHGTFVCARDDGKTVMQQALNSAWEKFELVSVRRRSSGGNVWPPVETNEHWHPCGKGSSTVQNVVDMVARATARREAIIPPAAPVAPCTIPSVPTNVEAAPGNNKVNLTWDVPENNGGSVITGYEIQQCIKSGETQTSSDTNNVSSKYII